jgi:hypothetical protein
VNLQLPTQTFHALLDAENAEATLRIELVQGAFGIETDAAVLDRDS